MDDSAAQDDSAAREPGPDTAARASFFDLCKCLQSVLTKRGNEAKRQRMRAYIEEWRATGGDFFPALRLILPHLDKARTTYGMKDKVLAKTYVEVLGLAINSPDAESLINWRNPGKSGKATAGDFPGVLYQVIVGRSSVQGRSNVTIADVNEQLERLNMTTDRSDRRDIIRYFFANCTPMEQTWIARIILKELKLGISENTILNIWHPDALDKFNVCSDLSEVTLELRDPKIRLSDKDVTLGKAFKPMRAKSVDNVNDVPKAMGHNTFWVETKLDGERIQMHMMPGSSEPRFKWFSRRARDYSDDHYGKNKHSGSLVPYIYEQFDPKVQSVILDGELLAYNTVTEIYEPFGSLKTASNDVQKMGSSARLRPCFIVFDIVHLNGLSLVNQALKDRYEMLRKIVKEKKTFIEILPHQEGNTAQDVLDLLDERMARNEEGLIIKNPSSVYSLSANRVDDWLKLKPEYINAIGDDVDVLLIGGFYGEGRRGGVLSHFMCAVMEDPKPGEARRCISFCKVGSGYKFTEIETISRQSEGKWRAYDHRRPPAWFVHPANSKEKPDMILPPEHAQVIQVKAAEITPSDTYGAGYTLRFPRFVQIRTDKDIDGVMTFSQLHEYLRKNQGRMQTRRLDALDLDTTEKKKKRVQARRAAATSSWKVAAEYLGVDMSQITKTDDLFTGMEICVLPGAGTPHETALDHPPRSKHSIEATFAEHGGTAVQNPTKNTKMIIADQHTLKVSNFKKSGQYDIVQSRYMFDCIAAKEVIPLNPRYMIHTTEKTKEDFKQNTDKWGDSYFEDVRVSSLKELFSHMDVDHVERNRKRKRGRDSNDEKRSRMDTISEIEERYFSMAPHEGSLFRRISVYLDQFHNVRATRDILPEGSKHAAGITVVREDEPPLPHEAMQDCALDTIGLMIRARGGVINDAISESTTHIVMDGRDIAGLPGRTRLLRDVLDHYPLRHERRKHLVVDDWVRQAIEIGRLGEERNFEPNLEGRFVHIGGVGKSNQVNAEQMELDPVQ